MQGERSPVSLPEFLSPVIRGEVGQMLLALWDLSGFEMVFAACALLGGGLFVVRLVLFFIGGFGEADADAGVDVGDVDVGDLDAGDVDVGDLDAGEADVGDTLEAVASFKLMTLQGLTAFLMMFGLVGLALLKSDTGKIVATLGAGAAGAVTLVIVGKVFSSLLALQSSGTLDMRNAAGQEGTVYLRIPADGTGKVQVTVQEKLMVLNAVSESKEEMKTGDRVKVVRVIGGRTLSVEKI